MCVYNGRKYAQLAVSHSTNGSNMKQIYLNNVSQLCGIHSICLLVLMGAAHSGKLCMCGKAVHTFAAPSKNISFPQAGHD